MVVYAVVCVWWGAITVSLGNPGRFGLESRDTIRGILVLDLGFPELILVTTVNRDAHTVQSRIPWALLEGSIWSHESRFVVSWC